MHLTQMAASFMLLIFLHERLIHPTQSMLNIDMDKQPSQTISLH
jgi:hypothetical protein